MWFSSFEELMDWEPGPDEPMETSDDLDRLTERLEELHL